MDWNLVTRRMIREMELKKRLFGSNSAVVKAKRRRKFFEANPMAKNQPQIIRAEGKEEWWRIVLITFATVVAVIVVAIF